MTRAAEEAAAPARASDRSRYDALVRQYVPQHGDLLQSLVPKTAGVCAPGGKSVIGVACSVPYFDVDGSLDFFDRCDFYTVLGE